MGLSHWFKVFFSFDFRCERYYFLPANCQLVGPEGNNCCPILNCSKKQEECKDENELCESLGLAICSGDYKLVVYVSNQL